MNRLVELVFGPLLTVHQWLYERSDGRIGASLGGRPMLLLRTAGRRTGQPRTAALLYVRDDDAYVVIASKGGAPRHPGWFHNLTARPDVEIQVGRERIPVRARIAKGKERSRLWARADEVNQGQYAVYQSRTSRVIPVVVLDVTKKKHKRGATMRKRHAGHALAIIVGLLLAGIRASAAGGEEMSAAARIAAMANFLAKAQRLAVAADCTYDVVQDSGEKIEFGERRELTLRRPDRARVEVTRRDGSRRGLLFDGMQLTAFDLDEKVYATVAKPGTVDAALAYYTQDLGMRLPLRELFATDLPQELKEVLGSARLVGKEIVGGVATDHVAFRGKTADVQLWIARDGDPLPQRIAISYRLAEGQPQFEADFHGWTLNPDLPDSRFTFAPPEGVEKIPILKPGREREAAEKQP